MNLTALALDRRVVTSVALGLVALGGALVYGGMPRDEDPGFIIRTATVVTYFPGASPERVELLVTDKLEKRIQEIPQVDYIASQSKTGISVIFVNIKEEFREMRPIWDDLRRKVERAEDSLPPGIVGPYVNDEFGDVFGTVLTITGEGYASRELKDIADQVRDALLRVPDVAKVEISGAQDERIFVEYNNARLAEANLSAAQLQRILEGRNIIIPGGAIDVGPERLVLEPSGNFDSVEDLRRTVIELPGSGNLVYLDDLVSIRRGYVEPRETMVHASGVPALALAVSMKEGGNVIRLGQDVLSVKRRLEQSYPIGVEFDVIAFQPSRVDRKVRDFASNLLQAVAIVILVMLATLGLRTGLVVAALIPAAILAAFLVMSTLGIGLDQMSLAALIISLGLLVDNAIVMAESILVQIRGGKEAVRAAIDSAAELRVPLLTASLTTSAAFLPIFLAESNTGEYTAPIFKVVTITLLCSWVLSLTLTPLLAVIFLRPGPKARAESYDMRFYREYRRLLTMLLRHRALSVLGVAIVFFVSLQALGLVPAIFFPGDDAPMFTIDVTLPVGSRIERTEAVVARIEEMLAERLVPPGADGEGVLNWGTWIGSGAPRYVLTYSPEQVSPEVAYVVVNASSREYLEAAIPALEDRCVEEFPDATVRIEPKQLGPPVEAPVQVRISGEDTEALFAAANRVKALLAETPGAREIDDNWGPRVKKLIVEIDEARALRAGLTNQDVAVSLQTVLSGLESTQYREDDEIIPVILRSVAADRQDIGKFDGTNIYSQATGRNVPLRQVADARLAWEPSIIFRRDRLRTVTVDAYTRPGVTATEITSPLIPRLEDERAGWPIGQIYEMGGEMESSVKAQQSIAAKLPIAFMIILLLLVAQFDSLRKPIIILLTIPLGMIGVVVGLIVARSVFGFMTLLGLISLSGIVINNAIVLLERIQVEIDENGLSPARAILEASQRRLRPILLTTTTTVGGLIPLWLGGGPMFEPMAVAILFGLLFATLLTLGVVPILYSIFFRVDIREAEAPVSTTSPAK